MRLLIVRLSAMGDVIHALPLAENAHAAGATVGWLVERQFAGMLEGNPHCARIFVADTKRWRRDRVRTLGGRGSGDIRDFAPDQSTRGLWKSALSRAPPGADRLRRRGASPHRRSWHGP
jgi:ADP-heptose:LPS heptosyltransferase